MALGEATEEAPGPDAFGEARKRTNTMQLSTRIRVLGCSLGGLLGAQKQELEIADSSRDLLKNSLTF